MSKNETTMASTSTIAKLFDMTERNVRYLAEQGIIDKAERGKYPLAATIQKYIKYLRTKAFDKEVKFGEYDRERTLHEKAKREKAELLLLKMKNRLHAAEDVELIMTEMLVRFRNRILGIPAAIAPKLYLKTVPKIAEILKAELHSALTELSEYDPAMFADKDYEVLYDNGEEDDSTVPEDSESGIPAS